MPVKSKTGPRQDRKGIHAGRGGGELGNGNPPLPSAVPSQRRMSVRAPFNTEPAQPGCLTTSATMPRQRHLGLRAALLPLSSSQPCWRSPAAQPPLLPAAGLRPSLKRQEPAAVQSAARGSAPPAAEVGADAAAPYPLLPPSSAPPSPCPFGVPCVLLRPSIPDSPPPTPRPARRIRSIEPAPNPSYRPPSGLPAGVDHRRRERHGSGDSEREASMTRQMTFASLLHPFCSAPTKAAASICSGRSEEGGSVLV